MPVDRPHYRAVREREIPAAVALFFESFADLARRKGIGAGNLSHDAWQTTYRHVAETGSFEVAELGGRLLALCLAIVRGRTWFLSGFWTLPELQGQGVGGPLVRRALDWGRAQGATTFFTWSSVDTRAMGFYMKLGMLPLSQILTFAGSPSDFSPEPAGYASAPLALDAVSIIDEQTRGARREVDHRFLLARAHGHQVEREGQPVGYFYEQDGMIGPAAWCDESSGDALLSRAIRQAVAHGRAVRMVAPGMNHAAVRFALGCGLKLTAVSHLLSSGPLGRLDHYLPAGPTLF